MIGLEPAAEGSGQTNGRIAMSCDGDFASRINEVQIAHELTNRRHHFRCQPTAELPDIRSGGLLAEDPFPQV